MPQFDASTPTIARKFADFPITVPAVFAEGHALTAKEAEWANGQLATVVGNAFGSFIRRSKEADKKFSISEADAQAKFAEIFADYEFGGGRGSGSKSGTDPVEALARALATADLKARIAKKGLSVHTLSRKGSGSDGVQSKYAELLSQLMDREGDNFRAQAQAQLDSMDATAEDDLLAGIEPEAEAPTSEAA